MVEIAVGAEGGFDVTAAVLGAAGEAIGVVGKLEQRREDRVGVGLAQDAVVGEIAGAGSATVGQERRSPSMTRIGGAWKPSLPTLTRPKSTFGAAGSCSRAPTASASMVSWR